MTMPQVLSSMQYICFRKTCFEWGRHTYFLPRAPSNLVTPLSALKKQSQCTYVWRNEDVKAQGEDHFATRLPRLQKLTHTSKTRQVKCTQLVAAARFTFACLLLFQTAKNRTQRNRRVKGGDV